MIYKPHNYQSYATEFITEHPIAAIFLDCGLGKTIITLTAIHDLIFNRFEVDKVLVIAPLRVAKTVWSSEIEKWDHLKTLRYSIVVGTAEERKAALKADAEVYIINRENVQWLVEESGVAFNFDMTVIDELSSFKSHQTKRFKALMKVRPKVKRIVGLTGTPSSNGLMDLWAEFRLLDMGKRLGRYISHYRAMYFVPDKRNQNIVFSYKPIAGAEEAIYSKISDITISMKAADYLQLPDCVMNEMAVELSSAERKKYDMLKRDMVLSLGENEIDAVNAAALSNKLLQMANGAIYNDAKQAIEIHDRKLDALEDLIESANGHPLLVAYWFKHDRERIEKRLHQLHITFDAIDIDENIVRWNRGEIPIGLIHPASAGHGLNLQTGGSTLVWFGLTWSLELYQQTNARLYRQGQQSTVVIHHIITKGTIDENVMRALKQKDAGQAALMEAVKAQIGG